MASHHYHHHHCQTPPPTTTAATCCCGCSTNCYVQPQPTSPQQNSNDQLLQAIASLLQQQHPPKPQNPLRNLHHRDQQLNQHKQQKELSNQTQFVLSSLLDRINVLESSLHQFCTSRFHQSRSSSVRDSAARVIQLHFRNFLVRRSRSLRQLKDLAFIKSRFISLKSSISDGTHFDVEEFHQKAIDLLRKLDSIQGCDPMIREGKKSISRDLIRFLDDVGLVITVRRHECSPKNVKLVAKRNKTSNLKDSSKSMYGDKKNNAENLRRKYEKIHGFTRVSENDEEAIEFEGFEQVIDEDNDASPRFRASMSMKSKLPRTINGILVHNVRSRQSSMKKNVSFADDGNLSRVLRHASHRDSSSDYSDDNEEAVEKLSNQDDDYTEVSAEENEKGNTESGGPFEFFNRDKKPRNMRKDVYNFSAPLPVKMESRDDSLNKKGGRVS